MGRFGAVFAAALVVTGTAACSAPPPPAGPPTPATTTATTTRPATTLAATTKPTTPPFTPLVSPAKVTAACPFLGTGELQVLLGTSEDLVATEQPADPTYVPGTEFQCRYVGKYHTPWVLDLWIVAATRNYVPVRSVENTKQDCHGPVTNLRGIGEAAISCELADAESKALVMTGKRSHGQNRTATVYMVSHRDDVYTALAKTLADRL
ncbi:hypothetical protein ACGFMK_32990 [Amycolatopsis sp. NPDC049252]|uniref:hypothetical protein n=1 Tax=Amycolatopsis sp. NPDC049252 TaxID=3363933 RepID=UPI0037205E9B